MTDLVEFLRARPRRHILPAIAGVVLDVLTVAVGILAMMFAAIGMAGPAAAYAFVAGALSVRLVGRVWRWIRD